MTKYFDSLFFYFESDATVESLRSILLFILYIVVNYNVIFLDMTPEYSGAPRRCFVIVFNGIETYGS